MKKIDLKRLSDQQLVERFAALAMAQAQAEDDNAGYNRLYAQIDKVRQELKGRPGDRRRELLSLLAHPNAQVRLVAAKSTLAVSPQAARRVLQSLADSNIVPQAGDAGISLANLDRGIFRPD